MRRDSETSQLRAEHVTPNTRAKEHLDDRQHCTGTERALQETGVSSAPLRCAVGPCNRNRTAPAASLELGMRRPVQTADVTRRGRTRRGRGPAGRHRMRG